MPVDAVLPARSHAAAVTATIPTRKPVTPMAILVLKDQLVLATESNVLLAKSPVAPVTATTPVW